MNLHLDAETYSGTDIEQGLSRYFADPDYELLMLAWAIDHGPVELWVSAEGEPMPSALYIALNDPKTIIHAYNTTFEWHVLLESEYEIPIERFHCTMIQAWNLSFTGTLARVQEQVGIALDKRKMVEGRNLIRRFCVSAPKSHKANRYDRFSHPEEWETFKAYCVQDVVAERELELALGKWPRQSAGEDRLWHLDHRINQRGVVLDLPLVHSALRVDRQQKKVLRDKLAGITGLENPGSNPQFLEWLQCFYSPGVDNVRKETLQVFLQDLELSATVHDACKLKMQLSKTSNAKWRAMLGAVSADGRLRNVFQFAGAQRTKRWAGRIVQPHNLPASRYDDQALYEAAVESIHCEDAGLLEAIWGDTAALLSQSIRGGFVAAPGHSLVVSDYSSIESRVVGWMAGCKRINRIFAERMDTYKDLATELFHIPYAEVTKAQRKFSKPPSLGASYGLGARGLLKYAEGFGVDMAEEEAKHAIDTFRSVYPEIPAMWRNLLEIIQQAIAQPGHWFQANRVKAGLITDDMLQLQLPSGRFLSYFQPRWERVLTPWDEWRNGFTYMGVNRFTLKWERLSAHGGLVCENCVQAVARDILADGLLRADAVGLPVVLHVHDEICCEVPEDQAEAALEILTLIMSVAPPWASGLLLGAAGWTGHRYRKE